MGGITPGEFDHLHQTQAIRGELMHILTDADLAFRLPGNSTLGELIRRESGQVEQSYIDSFRTLKYSVDYPSVDPALETSVAKLNDWLARLDAELEDALAAYQETDVESLIVDRGWAMPFNGQFRAYREALLIFYAKEATYLRALQMPLPDQMSRWIG